MKNILFVCVENACRSQMAEGFAKQVGKGVFTAYSAGSHSSGAVNPTAIAVMKEVEIDISMQTSKGFNDLPTNDFDAAITLGCNDICPFVPAEKHISWNIEDPKGKGIDFFRKVRDNIKTKVEELSHELSLREQGVEMERHFDDQLKRLKTNLLKLATMAESAIYNSVEALKNRDKKLAQEVIQSDKKIDELELAIEETAIDLLALQQPVARDLRFITTGMKINEELERIADLAENIAQRVLELADQPLLKPLVDIPKLASVARSMVKNAIDAFVNRDEKLAKDVILADSEADSLRNAIYNELIDEYMVKNGKTAPRAVPLLLVARHLERICDHAAYIATDVIYLITAKVIRHHPEKLT